jgi:urease accessory protein
MGSRAARIIADEFLIPHEFRDYQLAEPSAGQIGGVRLGLNEHGGGTKLGRCYQQVPVRVASPFNFQDEPAALLYLLNPTAGLMDGDGHLLEIEAGPGTRTVVTGQSANRVHPAVSRFATQQWHVRVAPGAQLVILPGPTIPFRGCRYYQRVQIELQGDARLIWGDVWTPGRYARAELSERHQFERIVQELEVRRDGVLVYRDRFHWEGPWDSDAVRWHLGGDSLTASGGLFVTGPVERWDEESASPVRRAILPLESGDTLIRWCGPTTKLIHEVVAAALRLAPAWSGRPSSSPWLLSSNHLAPNHWFSPPPTPPRI